MEEDGTGDPSGVYRTTPPWVHPSVPPTLMTDLAEHGCAGHESKGAMGSKWAMIQAQNQSQVNLELTSWLLA